jgi:hypothetical protein
MALLDVKNMYSEIASCNESILTFLVKQYSSQQCNNNRRQFKVGKTVFLDPNINILKSQVGLIVKRKVPSSKIYTYYKTQGLKGLHLTMSIASLHANKI